MVTLSQIRDAEAALKPIVHLTPLIRSRTLDRIAGTQVLLKAENFQRAGSFKIRGAYNRIRMALPGAGVITFSSGNHAQGVALAARILGRPAVVVMPEDAPQAKVEATRGYGAEVVTCGRTSVERESRARELAKERGLEVIPPFDDDGIIAGQATVALELLAELPDIDTILVPVGGGGLLAGIAAAVKSLRPKTRVIGVEPETANAMFLSLQAGRIVEIPYPDTVADGLKPVRPGERTFEVARKHVDGVVLVSDREILDTLRFLLLRMKLLVEPSGAAAAAALLHKKLEPGKRAVAVLSGGNVDPPRLAGFLGAAGDGRP
jgi:threonine dehydratase